MFVNPFSISTSYTPDLFKDLALKGFDLDRAVSAVYDHRHSADYSTLERDRRESIAPILSRLPQLAEFMTNHAEVGERAALLRLDEKTYPPLLGTLACWVGNAVRLPDISEIRSDVYRDLWSGIQNAGLRPSFVWDKHTTTDVWSGIAGFQRLILCVEIPKLTL